jgi:M6 family metalloprotease-like protein
VLATAAVSVAKPSRSGAAAAACTYEQRKANAAALRKASAAIASARAAFFRRHKSAAQRAAFVRSQQAKLRSLRAAAACTVPPVPPSSGSSCSFTLEPNAESVRLEQTIGQPLLHEGRLTPGGSLRSLGRVNGIVLTLDFADAEGQGPAPAVAETYAPDPAYFDEVSYGRFSVSIVFSPRWIRMPQPSSEYSGPFGLAAQMRYFTDAITAADPYVDFSGIDFVILVPTRRVLNVGGGNKGWFRFRGNGVQTAEGEIRFGASVGPEVSKFGKRPSNHEFTHSLGLPDLYDDPSVGGWDLMSAASDGAPPLVHLIGWHKWRLGWLEPDQLTCVSAAGVVEETLTALAVPGGKKLVLVPTSPSTTYVVEGRARIGRDAAICEEGALVYDVDSQILNAELRDGRGVVHMDGPQRCAGGRGAAGGALHTGEVFEDNVVKVELLTRDARSFRVRITRK